MHGLPAPPRPDPNDEGSTADQVLPRTGSRPAAAHEMPGTCRSTMTPPGIGSTRAEVTGMVPSTLLKWWCPYTPMCSGVSSARSPIRSRSWPTVIAVATEYSAESTTMVVITRLPSLLAPAHPVRSLRPRWGCAAGHRLPLVEGQGTCRHPRQWAAEADEQRVDVRHRGRTQAHVTDPGPFRCAQHGASVSCLLDHQVGSKVPGIGPRTLGSGARTQRLRSATMAGAALATWGRWQPAVPP